MVKGASRCTGREGEETVFNTLLRLLFIELPLMHCYNAPISDLNAEHDTSHSTE